MKRAIIFFLSIILLSSCAKGVSIDACIGESYVYGFWGGLWHGIISPLDLIAMIWSDNVVVYAPNNNGGWYAFGFCLGAGILGFGGSKAKK
jgi:hypothetical protein